MSELIGKLLGSIIFVLLEFFSVRIIINEKRDIKDPMVIFLLLINIILITIIYSMNYSIITSSLVCLLAILISKLIFKEELSKTVVAVILFLVIDAISDMIVTAVFLNFMNIEKYTSVWWCIICSNFLIATLSLFILRIKYLREIFQKLIESLCQKKIFSILLCFLLTFSISTLIIYDVILQYRKDSNPIIMIAIYFSLLIFVFLFSKEIYNYETLQKEYNSLFDYAKNFEEWIEEEQYNRHEYKNQLAILRTKIKDKEIRKEIDNIIHVTSNVNQLLLEQLSRVPKGGIKGLIYYKSIIANNSKINLLLDISKNTEKFFLKLSDDQIKELTKLIGIYVDNAIEAAIQTKNKNVTLEIYNINEELNFVFSNSYDNKIDLSIIDQKGMSTKGKNRGKGLYFAKKILNENQWIKSERTILDNFYIQKLIIKI